MLNTISYNTDETPGSQSIGSDEIMARYGGSLPKAQDGDGIDFNSLQKGIK